MEIVFLCSVPSPSSQFPSGRKAELRKQWEKCGERRREWKERGKTPLMRENPFWCYQSLPVFPMQRERGQCLSWAPSRGSAPHLAQKGTFCAFHWDKKMLKSHPACSSKSPGGGGVSFISREWSGAVHNAKHSAMMWGWLVIYLLYGFFLWIPLPFIFLMLLPDLVIFVITACEWLFIIKPLYSIPHISCWCLSMRHVKTVEPKVSPKI